MYAERLMPTLERAAEVQSSPATRSMTPADRLRLAKGKKQAEALIPAVRAVLFPEDDDG